MSTSTPKNVVQGEFVMPSGGNKRDYKNLGVKIHTKKPILNKDSEIIAEIIDALLGNLRVDQQSSAEEPQANSYFSSQVLELYQGFSRYGVSTDEVVTVAKTLPDFDQVVEFLNGYVKSQNLVLANIDEEVVSLDRQLDVYKILKSNGSLQTQTWSMAMSALANIAHSKGYDMISSFNVAEKLGSVDGVGGFLDFYIPNEGLTLDDQVSLYKQSINLSEIPSQSIPMDDSHLVLSSVLNQEGYRINPFSHSQRLDDALKEIEHARER